jgi:hypothetical protein
MRGKHILFLTENPGKPAVNTFMEKPGRINYQWINPRSAA